MGLHRKDGAFAIALKRLGGAIRERGPKLAKLLPLALFVVTGRTPPSTAQTLSACDENLAQQLGVKGLNPAFFSELPYSSALVPSMGFATADMANAIDPTVANFMNLWGIPGGAVAITYKDQLIFAKSYGYVDASNAVFAEPDSRFRIASVTKTITAMGVLKLVHDGLLSLDDHPFPFAKVGPIIGGTMVDGTPNGLFSPAPLNPELKNITVDDILHHAGGWDRDPPYYVDLTGYNTLQGVRDYLQGFTTTPLGPPDCTTLLRFVESQPLQLPPGTEAHYSNIGFCALSELIRETSGASYIDYLSDHVLLPLGMNDTTLGSTPQSEIQDRESIYYDTYSTAPSPVGDPPLPSLFPPYGAVPRPYGNIGALEALEGAGGLLSTAIDLAKFTGAIASGQLPNLSEPGLTLPVGCSAGGNPLTTGWPVPYYADTVTLPAYENPADTVWTSGHWPFGAGWDSVPMAFTSTSSALLCYDDYNLMKDGGFPGLVSSVAVTADGYGFASVFNQNDNNVPAPELWLFWVNCADQGPPAAASSAANCALQAAYNHVKVMPWNIDFSPQYSESYTSWMDASGFGALLAAQKEVNLYPARVDGRWVGSEPQYRARFAPNRVQPRVIYGAPCSAVLEAIGSAPPSTPLVSLQRFYSEALSQYLYQAVWSAPIPELP